MLVVAKPVLGVPLKFQDVRVVGFPLRRGEIPRFVDWLFLDLAVRSASTGRRQKEPLRGVFCSIKTGGRGGMRRSDFTPRLVLAVHAYYMAGLPIQKASVKVSQHRVVNDRLGKARRGPKHSAWGEWAERKGKRVTEIDETVRTFYYKFRKKHPNMDDLLENQVFSYILWCNWAVTASERALELAATRHPNPGSLRRFVRRIRKKLARV